MRRRPSAQTPVTGPGIEPGRRVTLVSRQGLQSQHAPRQATRRPVVVAHRPVKNGRPSSAARLVSHSTDWVALRLRGHCSWPLSDRQPCSCGHYCNAWSDQSSITESTTATPDRRGPVWQGSNYLLWLVGIAATRPFPLGSRQNPILMVGFWKPGHL